LKTAIEQNKEKCHGDQLPADVEYVETEYRVVNPRGKSTKQRAAVFTGMAHPDFRNELTKAARKVTLI